uniref:S-protein homolog n=1 Tax=Panagrolaimus sp. PS1159 TaxID=55785 RepID=A0AC35F557_9BILA
MKFAVVFILFATISSINGIVPAFGPAVDFLVSAIAEGIQGNAGKTYVRLVNTMGKDVEVTADCASGDDKIDETKLKDGEAMAWSFNPNIWQTTLFWCDITTSDGKKKHWDVYTPEMDESPNWYLRGQGIYLGKFDGTQLQKKFDFE